MAAEIYGAVMRCGPKVRGQRYVLSALADIAGSEGIAWPTVATIAERCCMSEKQVGRLLADMKHDGWISVLRKQSGPYDGDFAQGKQSVYLISLEKLGLTPDTAPKLFARQRRKSPDTMSAESPAKAVKPGQKAAASPRAQERDPSAILTPAPTPAAADSTDIVSGESEAAPVVTHTESVDIPQGVHRTFAEKSPDISGRFSGHLRTDTVGRTGRNRRKATGVEPESTKSTAPTPLARGEQNPPLASRNDTHPAMGRDANRSPWLSFYYALRESFHGHIPPSQVRQRFTPLVPGEDDWDAGFEDARLDCEDNLDGGLRWTVVHPRPEVCKAFLEKYQGRVAKAMVRTLGVEFTIAVEGSPS